LGHTPHHIFRPATPLFQEIQQIQHPNTPNVLYKETLQNMTPPYNKNVYIPKVTKNSLLRAEFTVEGCFE
jgi:hypothetical protein